jgi:hypothetical protein
VILLGVADAKSGHCGHFEAVLDDPIEFGIVQFLLNF